MAAEASTPWWGRNVLWHTWPIVRTTHQMAWSNPINREIPTAEASLFWDTKLIVCNITTIIVSIKVQTLILASHPGLDKQHKIFWMLWVSFATNFIWEQVNKFKLLTLNFLHQKLKLFCLRLQALYGTYNRTKEPLCLKFLLKTWPLKSA